MKSKLIALIFLGVVQFTTAQNYQTVEEVNDACASLGFSSNEDAEIAVDNILDKIGLFRNFIIQECPNINNAVAKNIDVGSGRKERYILYDANFFKRIEDKASNDWAATSILAHEIGHHLNGHALNNEGSNHKFELQADEFSGFVLARMGSSLEDAQSAIQTLKYEKATRTHPAKADRLLSIEKGWSRGKGKTIVVKKIEEKVIKKITEKRFEDIADGEVTVQQVFDNYIEAIGGQENIMKIKTMSREMEMNTSVVANGKETKTVNQMTMEYLNPNDYLSKMTTNGSVFQMLKLGSKFYTKLKPNEKWKFSNYNDKVENQVSYVWEYSSLVNNSDVTYLGVKNINGTACHAIKLPNIDTVKKDDMFNMSISIFNTVYYSLESGLLVFMKTNNHSIIDYKDNNEYLKDSNTHTESLMIFTDYRSVNGVLFSFKTEMISDTDTYSSRSITQYTDIKVNPFVNKEDFELRD